MESCKFLNLNEFTVLNGIGRDYASMLMLIARQFLIMA